MRMHPAPANPTRQRGTVAVEFALLSLFVFFPLIFALFEVGRYMHLYNTMQEVTRRAAREATVRWTDGDTKARNLAMFSTEDVAGVVPGAPEIVSGKLTIEYLNKAGTAVDPANRPTDSGDNLSACNDALRTAVCIYSVRVELSGVQYSPFIGQSGLLNTNALKITMPASTVIMYAESLGFTN